jgi:hypothetical protein
MRSVLMFVTVAVSIMCAPLSANSQCPDSQPAVSVQIHDYVHLKSESLSAAKEIVTRQYNDVGVAIKWLGVIQQDVGGRNSASGGEGAHVPVAQLTINILTPAMAAHGGVPASVLGFVAVPPEGGMGRIGYVVYDRGPEVAAATQMSEGQVLGTIVAHDIRRLILGSDSESSDAVAKDRGDRADRERTDPFALNFSAAEIARLYSRLERDAASFPGAPVATAGTDPQGNCAPARELRR